MRASPPRVRWDESVRARTPPLRRHLRWAAHRARDQFADTLFGGAGSDSNRVHGGLGIGAPVGDHDLAGDTEQERSAGLPVVDPVAQRTQSRLEERAADFAGERPARLAGDAREQELADTLGRLEHDVTGESVGYHDVARAAKDVLAFDVADELDRQRRDHRVGRLDQFRTLLGLLAVAEQRDTGAG